MKELNDLIYSSEIDKQLKQNTLKALDKVIKVSRGNRAGIVQSAIVNSEPIEIIEELMKLAEYKKDQLREYRNWYKEIQINPMELSEYRTYEKELQKKLKEATREKIQAKEGISKHKATAKAKELKPEITKQHRKEYKPTEQKLEIEKPVFAHTKDGKLTAQAVKDITAVLKEANLSDEDIALYVKQTAPKQVTHKPTEKAKRDARVAYNAMWSKLDILVQAYEAELEANHDAELTLRRYQPIIEEIKTFVGAKNYADLLDPNKFKRLYRAKAKLLHPDLVGEEGAYEMQALNKFVSFMKDIHKEVA